MREPYRIFFPLGLLSAFIGVLCWVPFALGQTQNYPGTEHPHLMIGGFLFSFALGFLMTAIPRFTETAPAKSWELLFQAAVILLMIATGTASLFSPQWREASLLLQIVSLVLLILFCVPRFLSKKRKPPPSFLFIGVGILCGLLGSVLLYLDERGSISAELGLTGRSLFYHGMMLSFVIGVGSRLIPVLLGHEANPMNQDASPRSSSNPGVLLGLAVVYFLSFPVELFASQESGRIARAMVLLFVSFRFWRIFVPPVRRGSLPLWLRIAGIMLLLGQWSFALFPGYAVHGVHLTFAGGYSLLTLLIATRVVLSHGGYDLSLELKSRWLHVLGALVAASALARFLAPLAPASYVHHLAYASFGWSLGVGMWAFLFLPRMWRKQI